MASDAPQPSSLAPLASAPVVAAEAALVSLITPARDAAPHLDAAAASVAEQTHRPLEWLVFDDGSSDATRHLLDGYRPALAAAGVALRVAGSAPGSPARGCGYGRNEALALASPHAALFVLFDADDEMAPQRCALLLAASAQHPNALLGSRYWRPPGCGRPRDLAWHNGMTQAQLATQALRETTLAAPTWAFNRETLLRAGGAFDAAGPHNAEDLMFFYAHLNNGGGLVRLDRPLVHYRHTSGGAVATRSVPAALIWSIRLRQLEVTLASNGWLVSGFTIWNAGKEGRSLYRGLSPLARAAVRGFVDVCARKVGRGFVDDPAGEGRYLPCAHFRAAKPPLLLCVKLGLHAGGSRPGEAAGFEDNLASLGLREGSDYLHFS